jgi:hypothetical protein
MNRNLCNYWVNTRIPYSPVTAIEGKEWSGETATMIEVFQIAFIGLLLPILSSKRNPMHKKITK